ncbi:MAG TPA: helix-turn-helix domain-containing protein, partial [Miltoncostaeaceae bacterium]|nr:helix-turn-helix domain-containing protein [Miltoncostaeaceae bacterium]
MPDRPGRDLPRTLTASEAAALIGVSVATVRGWADSGLLPSHRTVGGHRRFELGQLRDWLAARGAPVAERLRPPREG